MAIVGLLLQTVMIPCCICLSFAPDNKASAFVKNDNNQFPTKTNNNIDHNGSIVTTMNKSHMALDLNVYDRNA